MSVIYHPIVYQNATWEISFTVTKGDGSPFNLTGYTGQSQIKASPTDNTVLASPTVTIVNTVGGIVKVSLSIVQTAALAATSTDPHSKTPLPVYDVLIANTDLSKVYRVLRGSVTVEAGVTHWTS
jgi:hypothetical protein